VEENQKQFFNTFVLYNPGIKVIEAVGVDKKKEDCHCAWTVKYRPIPIENRRLCG
jgi:hypothetical protein